MERNDNNSNNNPKFTDMLLDCVDCGRTFVITASEQSFFYSKHLSTPKRCPECRQRRREQGGNNGDA